MLRSATAVTVVVTGGATFFVEFGSPVGELTLATLVNVPLAGAVTVTVTLVRWRVAKGPRFQFTTPGLFTPPLLALTKLTEAGRVSVTTTLLALQGPRFVMAIV